MIVPVNSLLLFSLFFHTFLCCPEDCSCSEGRIVSVKCQSRTLTQFINVSHLPEKTAEIDLHDNQISRISIRKVKAKFSKLQRVNLEKNYLTEFDIASILNQFQSVTNMGLRDNILTRISFQMVKSENNLEVLDIGKNQIEYIGDNSFLKGHKLSYLYLDENKIDRIDEEGFNGLINLKYLYLQSNHLKILKSSWLKPLVRLERLQLENNKIAHLLMEEFEWPKTLYELNLKRNILKLMPILPDRPYGASEWLVDMRNNPVYCGCKNPRYSFSYLSEYPLCNLKAVCTSPEDMHEASVRVPFEVLTECNQALNDSLWKMYAEKHDCIIPEIKAFFFNESDEQVLLTCQVDSYPLAKVEIIQEDPERILDSSYSKHTAVNVTDAGWVRCKATNILGETSARLFVPETNVPLIETTPALTTATVVTESLCVKEKLHVKANLHHLKHVGYTVAAVSMLVCLIIIVAMAVLCTHQEDLYDRNTYIYVY